MVQYVYPHCQCSKSFCKDDCKRTYCRKQYDSKCYKQQRVGSVSMASLYTSKLGCYHKDEKGVGVKHGSYARYLQKFKSKNIIDCD